MGDVIHVDFKKKKATEVFKPSSIVSPQPPINWISKQCLTCGANLIFSVSSGWYCPQCKGDAA